MTKIKISKDMETVFETLNKCGYECFIVGGCVRDFLLNKKPHDIDFATNATPNEIKKCFKGYSVIETGIKHGTVTVIINDEPYEITTYRIDGEYIDNRKPESVEFVNDIRSDLSRRDFTINALAYNPTLGLIDEVEGIKDLNKGIIRCVNDPVTRFNEDALRILRALRFSSSLGYEIEKETKDACFQCASLLNNISMERIRDELYKTLMGKNAHHVIFEYIDIYGVVIPELLKMKGFKQHSIHHKYDVLKHTCVALEGACEDLLIRLTVLFHDIGKPDCFTMDEKGNGHFYGHALKSVDITRNILNRLKIDNKTKHNILILIQYHDLDLQPTKKYIRKLCYKLGSLDMVKKLILFQRADNYGQAGIHKERIGKFDEMYKLVLEIEEENLAFNLHDLAVDGNDMMELGFKGKQIGENLNYLLEAVLNEKVDNNKDDLLEFLKSNKYYL